MIFKKAIYDALIGYATVTDDLSTYEFTTGTDSPAIFTSREVPENSERPCITIAQIGPAVPWGTRDKRGSEIFMDAVCWGNKTMTDDTLAVLAQNVYERLDRFSLTITGYDSVLCIADAPLEIDDEEGFPGYVVRCRVKALEQ